jgi:hypothetical protein
VLNALSFAPLPNSLVKGTPTQRIASGRPNGRPLPRALGGANQGSGITPLVMSSNAKHPPALHMRERSSSPSLHLGNSSIQAIRPHRLAISPSAAGEPTGMFTTHSPSPIGLPVLLGSQRTTALCQSATRHRQVGRLSRGSQRTDQAARTNLRHLANSLEFNKQREAPMYLHGYQGGTASLCSTPSPSLPCLTHWSRGRPLSASLRPGQAGAPYRGR